MTYIVLTEEQARVLAEGRGAVEVRDPAGNWVGVLDPEEAAVVAEARRRMASGKPGIPAERVEAHLRALQAEWDRTGGFDREYLHAFLEKLRADDARCGTTPSS
jgi:hypothetical protein